jgi:hypothetical protein
VLLLQQERDRHEQERKRKQDQLERRRLEQVSNLHSGLILSFVTNSYKLVLVG